MTNYFNKAKSFYKIPAIAVMVIFFSFKKYSNEDFQIKANIGAGNYSSEVLDKWMALQIRLMSGITASFNGPVVRIYSYSSIAAYASIHPGISRNAASFFSLSRINQMPSLPLPLDGKKYHWPSSTNAALAYMNRVMFQYISASNKMVIDSLEMSLKNRFAKEADAATIERSMAYGQEVAQRIFSWSETDGNRQSNAPYAAPKTKGLWVPTPPTFAKAVTPYWGNLRPMVFGTIDKTQPLAPPIYSEDSLSAFYKMVKEVYDVSGSLTPDQKDITLFWRDINPGITAPGHWLNILRQVIRKENSRLDKSAFAYILTGISLNDAWISCWKTRYIYNVLRPVTYIREVMGKSDWLPLLTTPPHPEYTSGFAAIAGSVSAALATVFGNEINLTDHTYDDLGMRPRKYTSFTEIAKEAADSKFYGGIHYRLSVEVGLEQGRNVTKEVVTFLLGRSGTVSP